MQRTRRSSRSTDPRSSPTASLTRSPAPYSSSTSAASRSARGVVPAAASISRSASAAESVLGSRRILRGAATSAAGLSGRSPSSCSCRKKDRSAASRRATVELARPAARRSARYCSICSREADAASAPQPPFEVLEVAPVAIDRPRCQPRAGDGEEAVDRGAHVPSAACAHPRRLADARPARPQPRDDEDDGRLEHRQTPITTAMSSQKRSGIEPAQRVRLREAPRLALEEEPVERLLEEL